MLGKIATLTVQKWGNSLAVRIPAVIARDAHFRSGMIVELAVQKEGITVRSTGDRKLTLEEKLAIFDPKKHSEEIMPSKRVGLEKF